MSFVVFNQKCVIFVVKNMSLAAVNQAEMCHLCGEKCQLNQNVSFVAFSGAEVYHLSGQICPAFCFQ